MESFPEKENSKSGQAMQKYLEIANDISKIKNKTEKDGKRDVLRDGELLVVHGYQVNNSHPPQPLINYTKYT